MKSAEPTVSDEALAEFFEFLRFPSISARPEHRPSVISCAQWLAARLDAWGLRSSLISADADAPPVVVARNEHRSGRPTVLIYGHYDVQPVEPLELWESAPFEPVLRDGMVVARGATDNKGQTFSLLLGIKQLLSADGGLPVNLIVVAEGEEEVGSPHFGRFLEQHAPELACDVALIADTSMVARGRPAITLGLRGIVCLDVVARGPRQDLHSGMFGGPIVNPAMALCKALAQLTDAHGTIQIPHFYEDVLTVGEAERADWHTLPWNSEWFYQATGARPVCAENCSNVGVQGEAGFSLLERVWARPTAEINGLTSGHQGSGSKTIIPSQASAKLSFRLVPNQSSEKIGAMVRDWLELTLRNQQVSAEVSIDHGGEPFYMPPEHPMIRRTAEALESVFGIRPAFVREGLSIPAALLLHRHLGAPVVLVGLGLPDCKAHGPNETFPVEQLARGAQFLREFFKKVAPGPVPERP